MIKILIKVNIFIYCLISMIMVFVYIIISFTGIRPRALSFSHYTIHVTPGGFMENTLCMFLCRYCLRYLLRLVVWGTHQIIYPNGEEDRAILGSTKLIWTQWWIAYTDISPYPILPYIFMYIIQTTGNPLFYYKTSCKKNSIQDIIH